MPNFFNLADRLVKNLTFKLIKFLAAAGMGTGIFLI